VHGVLVLRDEEEEARASAGPEIATWHFNHTRGR